MIRQQFDLYTHDDEIQVILMNHVVKDEIEDKVCNAALYFKV